ncbi:hypothetical protein DYI24_02455 [Rhodopseudomonas sp. BR0C11]|uniref:hypothetical protein n=1 Tax=Rhodopseudomonas sp. BR0C11 TaxID=2269370 RepID=UPI0013E09E6E|nr:hypothetical protein [Rhodopseudomonas sp. BR0C11]NEV75906.1 hypothetical protein [Rhodopseudomonas sp. BR0C11]
MEEIDMVRGLAWKLGLLVCLWYEIAVELKINGTAAFLVAMLVIAGGLFVLRLPSQLAGMIGPSTLALMVHGVAWLVVYFAVAPRAVTDMPLVLTLAAVAALVMMGGQCRMLYERERRKFGREVWARHSTVITGAVLGVLFLGMVAIRQWHSIWPLVAAVLLPGLPFMFGWRMGPIAGQWRADAKFGSAKDFRKAGFSEER